MNKIKSEEQKKVNNTLASILEVTEVQRLNFRLIELASSNSFDGFYVVRDLLKNRKLWEACVMDRSSYSIVEEINKWKTNEIIDLIKLRDVSKNFWNVDTLFIYVNASKTKKECSKLSHLAIEWGSDYREWIEWPRAGYLLGGGPSKNTKILKVFWD